MFVFVSLLLLFIGVCMFLYADGQIQKIKKEERFSDYYNSSYFIFTRKSYKEVMTNKGTNGEYKIFSRLRPYEQIGEKFLFNVYLPKGDGTTSEIDMLFITTKGVFVIESKNYRGEITGDYDDFWWNQKIGSTINNKFYNPIKQNNSHVETLKKYLPADVPVYSVIVFSNNCGFYNLPELPRNTFVVHISSINVLINEILNNNENAISFKDVDDIQKALFPFSQAPEYVKSSHVRNINQMLDEHKNDKKIIKEEKVYSLKELIENGKVVCSE